VRQAKNKSTEATTPSEFGGYLAYNMDTNMPMPVLTWWHEHAPEFPQRVTLARKYLDDRHRTGSVSSICTSSSATVILWRHNQTFCYLLWQNIISGNLSKSAFFKGGALLWAQMEGASPTNHCWCQKICACPFVWYQNIHSALFGFVTEHVCDRQMDGQNYNSQDHGSIAVSCGNNKIGIKFQFSKTKFDFH